MQEKDKNIERDNSLDHPLSMTVYDLPEPNEVLQNDANRTLKGRLFMIGVLLVCAAPVVFSYLTYYFIRPSTVKSFGELIQPTRGVPSVQGRLLMHPKVEKDVTSAVFDLQTLKGQWLLISLADATCDKACQDILYSQRQVHTALGKEKDRMDRVWLVSGEGEVAPELLRALGDAWVIKVSKEDISKWLVPSSGHTLGDHLYLVDPMGEWMMRFPSQIGVDTAPKVRKDLERLLRASESWDLPGRTVMPISAVDVDATKVVNTAGAAQSQERGK